MQSARFGKGAEDKKTEMSKGERFDVIQQAMETRTDVRLSGVPEAQLSDMSRVEVQQRIESNLRENGATEEDARVIAESRVGTEALSQQTDVKPEEMPNLTYGQIKERAKPYGDLGLSDDQIVRLNEQETALGALPHQLEKTKDLETKVRIIAFAVNLAKIVPKIKANEQTDEESHQVEFISKYGLMNSQQAQEVNTVLAEAGYSMAKREEIQTTWYQTGEDTYVKARMEGKTEEQARKVAAGAQKEYLEGVYQEMPAEYKESFSTAAALSLRQMEIGAKAIEQAAETGDMNVVYAAQDAVTEQQQRDVVTKYSLMSAFAVGAMFGAGALFGEAEGEEAGGEQAAAQAQLMRDIMDLAKEDQERANEAKELLDELMEQAEESGEETTVGDLKDDELKERLEEMGIEQDKTIKDAIEFTNKTMETLAAQQGRVDELKQNAVEGLEPSFHTDPKEALEMNGIMKDGELTGKKERIVPAVDFTSGKRAKSDKNSLFLVSPQ